MKKILALLLIAAVLCAALTACDLPIIGELFSGAERNFSPEAEAEREDEDEDEDEDAAQTDDSGAEEASVPVPTEAPRLSNAEIHELLKACFYEHHTDSDKVILADVTHDGMTDMLVVESIDNDLFINGYVYSPAPDGSIRLIYTNQGSYTHAGGFYSWYLRPLGDGTYNLGVESFGMWQGFGILAFTEYYLDPDGNQIVVDQLKLDTSEEGVAGEYGVKEEYLLEYTDALNGKVSEFYDIYHTFTESAECFRGAATSDPAVIFAE